MSENLDVVHIFSIDGAPVDEIGLLRNLHIWLDTHFITAWYKNGNGFFVKFRGSDKFLKVVHE